MISTTGQVSIIAAPADARINGPLESTATTFPFSERTGFVLPSALTVGFTSTGSHTANPVPPLPVLAAGTLADSYYFVVDPVGADPNNNRLYDGSITFGTDILGIIALDAEFAASNATLGHPGTLYSASGIAFRWEVRATRSSSPPIAGP